MAIALELSDEVLRLPRIPIALHRPKSAVCECARVCRLRSEPILLRLPTHHYRLSAAEVRGGLAQADCGT